jgi:hypothetical protein
MPADAPARVLPRHPLHQRGDNLVDRGRSGRLGRHHFVRTKWRCQRRIVRTGGPQHARRLGPGPPDRALRGRPHRSGDRDRDRTAQPGARRHRLRTLRARPPDSPPKGSPDASSSRGFDSLNRAAASEGDMGGGTFPGDHLPRGLRGLLPRARGDAAPWAHPPAPSGPRWPAATALTWTRRASPASPLNTASYSAPRHPGSRGQASHHLTG